MKLIVAGVGPGDPELITLAALRAAEAADLVLAPCSGEGKPSLAGQILRAHLPHVAPVPLTFPMTQDPEARDGALERQLEALRPRWEGARTVLLPVIGDSTLYATGAWLHEVWRRIAPGLELELIPGVSAHSLAASRAGRFLAMGEDVLSVIPGTAAPERIREALGASDAAALYKPGALGKKLRGLVMETGPWARRVRVDRAGLPGERVFRDGEALELAGEYLSLLLLWRS